MALRARAARGRPGVRAGPAPNRKIGSTLRLLTWRTQRGHPSPAPLLPTPRRLQACALPAQERAAQAVAAACAARGGAERKRFGGGASAAPRCRAARAMTTIRRFVCDDLFRFNNVNLDPLTETVRAREETATHASTRTRRSLPWLA
jgi:hypothetical protein